MIKHAAIVAVSSLFLTATGMAADEGTAVGVKPEAVSRTGAGERVLVVGADVSVGERIVTGPTGTVQLLFKDRTRLVVGPRSMLEIETYLLNGNQADEFAINALAGTFRFISGNSPKSAYSIDTPAVSIAVRGTKFDVTVGGGQTLALLYEGALRLCRGGDCVDLTRRCDIGAFGGANEGVFTGDHAAYGTLAPFFPLPNIQSAFAPDFRVSGAQACLQPPIPPEEAISDDGSGSPGSAAQSNSLVLRSPVPAPAAPNAPPSIATD